MGTGLIIRDAAAGDLPAVTALYGHSVRTGAGSFEYDPPDHAEMTGRFARIRGLGLPWLTAEVDGAFAGYAYAGPFRMRAGYGWLVEDSVYVEPDLQGRGVGAALLTALVARCEAMGLRQMVAVIGDADNTGSIRLHERCGFTLAGAFRSAGWKLDGWRDVIFMQRALGPGDGVPPAEEGLPFIGA
ncbi:MAG: N-acetyltransferase family protein [Brevundimonas sp.]